MTELCLRWDLRGVTRHRSGHSTRVIACRVFGHDFVFATDGVTMHWSCARGCGAGGAKVYAVEADARRYAEAFNAERERPVGHRGPLIALFPLRMFQRLKRRSAPGAGR